MKISVIPEQVAETLDAENHFIVREVFDVHLSDQGFELSTGRITSRMMTLMKTLLAMAHSSTKSLSGRLNSTQHGTI